jgi:hypothetical protein
MSPQENDSADPCVRLFHASLVWPLQIEPRPVKGSRTRHWEVLEASKDNHCWTRIDDEFTEDPGLFRERHYREFVSFLPYVQRFLYGEGRFRHACDKDDSGSSPMHVFRRKDITSLRVYTTPMPPSGWGWTAR